MVNVVSVSSTQNGSFGVGLDIAIQIQFSGNVDVDISGGIPTLQLETGSVDRSVAYVSGSGTDTLSFRYTVQAEDASGDLDVLSVNALSLQGATIRDAGTANDASIVLPPPGGPGSLGANNAIIIDTTSPTLAISSDKATMIAGQTATITFTFSEEPVGFSAADITVSGGTLGTLSGSGVTRTATFTPDAGTNHGTASITVAAGSYTDAAGNAGGAASTPSITFDTHPPAAPGMPHLAASSDSGASSSDNVTNVVRPTFTGAAGSAEAGATLHLYDSNGTTDLGSTTVDGDGSWEITTTSALGQGTHTITAKAVDPAGNVGAASNGVSVTIDTTAPAAPAGLTLRIADDSGFSGTDGVTSVRSPVFNGSAEAHSTVTLYDTDGVTVIGTALTNGSGAWSIAASALAEGTHTITAKATDAAGNTSAASGGLNVTIDTTAPAAPTTPTLAAASDSGASNSDHLTNVATLAFSGSAEAGATVFLYDTDGSTVGFTVARGDGSWSATTSSLAEGAHTLVARAVDLAGNVSAASGGVAVNIDLTVPVAQVNGVAFSADTGPSSTDFVTNQASQTIAGILSASLGAGERVEVSLDNGLSWTVADAMGDSGWQLNATLAGAGTLQARVVDAAGNASAAYRHAYVLDTIAPTAPSRPDLDDDSDTGSSHTDDITGSTMPRFSGLAESGSTITLYDGARIVGSGVAEDGIWHITSTTLGQGSHDITAVATDLAGNRSTASDTLTIQVVTDAPTTGVREMYLTSDSGASSTDFVTNAAGQTIEGRLDASLVAGERVELSFDGGQTWIAADSDGDAWTLVDVILAPGTSTIAVRVANAVDNAGPLHLQDVTLDNDAPSVAISSDLALLKAGQSATITFTFSEDPGATFSWDGSNGNVVVSGGTLSALSGTGSIRTAVFTPDADTNGGTASITVPAGGYSDLAGNAGSAGVSPTLTFDTLAPAAPSAPALASGSDTGVSASDNITANERPTFTGSAESGAIVALRDADGSVIGSSRAVDGAWSIVPSARLAQGAHAITATARDSAGNASAASGSLAVTVDSVAPTLVVRSDTPYAKSGDTPTITFTFSEDPGATFSAHDITVEGGTLGALSGSGLVRTALFTPQDGVNGGVASIRVDAGAYTDKAGNAGGAGSVAMIYDTQAPDAPSVPDLEDASDTGVSSTDDLTANTTPTFYGSAEIGSTVDLYAGTVKIGSAVATYGPWSITSTTLAAGTHTITAIATDPAGNVGPASEALEVRIVTGPSSIHVETISFSADTGASATDLVTNTAAQTVSGTLNGDLSSGDRVEVSFDGGQHWSTAELDAPDHWSLATTLSAGTGTITTRVVNAVEIAGSETSEDYTLDTSAPSVAISTNAASLHAGGTALITFHFDEQPSGFALDDLTITGGTIASPTATANPLIYTALFTPRAGFKGDASVTVGNGYTDTAGNGGTGDALTISVDTTTPVTPTPTPTPPHQGLTPGADFVTGTLGDDRIDALDGNDTVTGALGNDTITAGEGEDIVFGNQGTDVLYGNQGNDTLYGGKDDDYVEGNLGNDYIEGNLGNDLVLGNQGNDTVNGNQGNDTVHGGQGDDLVHGGQGDDLVFGDKGNDSVWGGLGNDTLVGGEGSDTFFFGQASGNDIIVDFNAAEGDRLDFQGQTYVVQDIDGSAVFTLSGGGVVVLTGVSAASLEAGAFA